MRAYALDGFGETGSIRDLPLPEPTEGQVRVRLVAAGVNPADASIAAGYMKDMIEHRFPLIPGLDGSGTVDEIGPSTEGFDVGDQVFGGLGKPYMGEGTFADYATMSVLTIARKPAAIDHLEAAAIPTPGITALTLLDAVDAREGETLLAVGASGGVGTYLVQIAADRGVHVIGVAGGENADYVRGLGVAGFIDYKTGGVDEALRSLSPDGIDAIVDMAGDKEAVSRLSEQLRSGGRVASSAGGADEDALGARGVKATNVMARVTGERLNEIAKGLEEGRLRSPQIETFTLDQAAEALARAGARHTRGKLVIAIS